MKLVGIVVLAAFVLVAGTDRFMCPDGCATEAGASTDPHTPVSLCVLCALGVDAPSLPASSRPSGVVASVSPAVQPVLQPGALFTLEHPPRPA